MIPACSDPQLDRGGKTADVLQGDARVAVTKAGGEQGPGNGLLGKGGWVEAAAILLDETSKRWAPPPAALGFPCAPLTLSP